MSSATDTTVTVTFDPNAINLQADIIGAATTTKAGVMTAAQVAQLSSLSDLTPTTITELLNLLASLPPATVTDLLNLLASLPPSTVTMLINLITLNTASAGPRIFTNLARPPANDPQFNDALSQGFVAEIWNSTDKQPNFSDGINWYDADGNLT